MDIVLGLWWGFFDTPTVKYLSDKDSVVIFSVQGARSPQTKKSQNREIYQGQELAL